MSLLQPYYSNPLMTVAQGNQTPIGAPPVAAAPGGMQGLLSNPLLGMAIGLMGGDRPGGTLGGGFNLGLANAMAMQRQQQATALIGAQIQDMRRKRQEAEREAARQAEADRARNEWIQSLPADQQMAARAVDPNQYMSLQQGEEQLGLQERGLDIQQQQAAATAAQAAATREATANQQSMAFARNLRGDFVRENQDAMDAANNYRNLAPLYEKGPEAMTGADDIKLVYGLGKLMAPGEAIQEGDKATLINAGGVPGFLKSFAENLAGGGTLDPQSRRQLLAMVDQVGQDYLNDIDARRANVGGLMLQMNQNPEQWLPSYDRSRYEPSQEARRSIAGVEPIIQNTEGGLTIRGNPQLDNAANRYLRRQNR